MRTVKFEIRIPANFAGLLTKHYKEQGYKNLSRYALGTFLYEFLASRSKNRLRDIANANPTTRDLLVDEIVKVPLSEVNELLRIANGDIMAKARARGKKKRKQSLVPPVNQV